MMSCYIYIHANGEIVERFEIECDFDKIRELYYEKKKQYDKGDKLFAFDVMIT